MRVLLHRVRSARVRGGPGSPPEVRDGLAVMVGFGRGDDEATCRRMALRALRARIFPAPGSMLGQSALDVGSSVLLVSQMPLAADTGRGAKPNLAAAAPPDAAAALYESFRAELERAATGPVYAVPFASSIDLDVRHWGPFSLVLDG